MVSKVKITVLRRMSNPDLFEEYAHAPEIEPLCEHFQEGQEFVVEMLQMPKGQALVLDQSTTCLSSGPSL